MGARLMGFAVVGNADDREGRRENWEVKGAKGKVKSESGESETGDPGLQA